MNELIFNFIDIFIFIVSFEYLAAIVVLAVTQYKTASVRYMLLFSICKLLALIFVLVYFKIEYSPQVFGWSSYYAIRLIGISLLLEGLLFYWAILSLVVKRVEINWVDWTYFAGCILFSYVNVFHRSVTYPVPEGVPETKVMVLLFIWGSWLIMPLFAARSVQIYIRYRGSSPYKEVSQNLIGANFFGVPILISAAAAVWITKFAVGWLHKIEVIVYILVGVLYLFEMVLAALVIGWSITQLLQGLRRLVQEQQNALSQRRFAEYVHRLEAVMQDDQPYLKNNLSLEQLAERIRLPRKTLSAVINRRYQKNFFDFINSFRVERAKQLLADPGYADKSLVDIYNAAGFNSKTSFNTIFKKTVGLTPSEYRKQTVIDSIG